MGAYNANPPAQLDLYIFCVCRSDLILIKYKQKL